MAENDKIYRYSGPLTGVTLPDGRDVTLAPGGQASLPPDNPFTRRLVALGRLADIDQPTTATPLIPPLSRGTKKPSPDKGSGEGLASQEASNAS